MQHKNYARGAREIFLGQSISKLLIEKLCYVRYILVTHDTDATHTHTHTHTLAHEGINCVSTSFILIDLLPSYTF